METTQLEITEIIKRDYETKSKKMLLFYEPNQPIPRER